MRKENRCQRKDIWRKLNPNNAIALCVEGALAHVELASFIMPDSLKILSCLYFLAPSELLLESQISMLEK